MIENVNASKNPGEFTQLPRYIGVASVNILAINPDNAKLRKYGFNISDGSDEPNYIVTYTQPDGTKKQMTKIRFLVQIQDIESKPIIYLDYLCSNKIVTNRDNTKGKIIDTYGRCAWATKDEIKGKQIPTYADGKAANIGTPYSLCHQGEEEIITFLFKYLNITPFQIFNRATGKYENSKNPGKLTIDNWEALCNGNIKELAQYVALQPENRVKVILGVNTTENNRSYQTFIPEGYIGNGALPDRTTGEYNNANKLIERFMSMRDSNKYSFSAKPVCEWKVTPSNVDATIDTSFSDEYFKTETDDLPF